MIVLNEDHLRRILSNYFDYYHAARPHLSLDSNSPNPRDVDLPESGEVASIPSEVTVASRATRNEEE